MRAEKRYLRKDGGPIWADLTIALACDSLGMPMYEIAVFDDITPHKQAEERIQRITTA